MIQVYKIVNCFDQINWIKRHLQITGHSQYMLFVKYIEAQLK